MIVSQRKYRLIIFFLCLTLSPFREVLAEEQHSEPVAEETLVPKSSPDNPISALDDWQDLKPPEEPTAVETPAPEPTEEEQVIIIEKPPESPIKGGEVITLNRRQRKRMELVEKRIHRQARIELAARVAAQKKDPRGMPEVRICSANLNGYGEKDEVKRLLKKPGVERLPSSESSFLRAAVSSNCDVIALQGIVGRSATYAQDALEALAKKLEKRLKKKVQGIIAQSSAQTGFQAFLVIDVGGEKIKGFRTETKANEPLRIPGEELTTKRRADLNKNEIVPRDFLQLIFEVVSKEREITGDGDRILKKNRTLNVLNGIVAKSLIPFGPEDPVLKMQVAEAALRLQTDIQGKITPFEQPIAVLALERLETIRGGIEQIVEGRLEMEDFLGNCRFKSKSEDAPEKEKKGKKERKRELISDSEYTCKERPHRPVLLFEVLSKNELKLPNKKAGDWRKVITSGLYLVSADLHYAQTDSPFHYGVGAVPIKNGLPAAHLVWVDINW